MSTIKMSRAVSEYRARGGFCGAATVDAIKANLPIELYKELTGRQIGIVMAACNSAFHKGKAATGAEMVDEDAVWIASRGIIVELPLLPPSPHTPSRIHGDGGCSCDDCRSSLAKNVA
jgi:hypothetical protein